MASASRRPQYTLGLPTPNVLSQGLYNYESVCSYVCMYIYVRPQYYVCGVVWIKEGVSGGPCT